MTATASHPAPHDAPPRDEPPIRVLYLYPDTLGPQLQPERNALYHLSRHFAGDFLAVWVCDPPEVDQVPALSRALGRFEFDWLPWNRQDGPRKSFGDLRGMLARGRALARARGGYDLIVAYGPYRVGVAGAILKRLTGARLILEFPGRPLPPPSLGGGRASGVKRAIARRVVRAVARAADHWRLLYPTQLDDFPELAAQVPARASVFHEFVPVHALGAMDHAPDPQPYLLFLGHPWRLKGVDVLIRAWQSLAPVRGDWRLKIVGHCPDRAEWEAMRAGDASIEFHKGVLHEDAMRLVAASSGLVLPSRTEAMGRVLLEAMAMRKPVVATRVDGIPFYVTHEETGLLCEAGDVDALARQLRRVLTDRAFTDAMAARGQARVREAYDEAVYVERFHAMARRALAGR